MKVIAELVRRRDDDLTMAVALADCENPPNPLVGVPRPYTFLEGEAQPNNEPPDDDHIPSRGNLSGTTEESGRRVVDVEL